nr:transposase [Paenibacillus agricola]
MNEFNELYHEVKRWARPLHHVADIFNPDIDQTSESVQLHMKSLIQWLEQTYVEAQDQPMVSNFKSYTKGFWKGLFTCYDHPYVPRTNNDHERFFRQTKTRHRRMTGLRSWNEYIVRSGEFVVFVDDALRQTDVMNRLRSVSYEVFHAERLQWSKRLQETTKRRRFRRNPTKYLKDIENKFCTLIGQA